MVVETVELEDTEDLDLVVAEVDPVVMEDDLVATEDVDTREDTELVVFEVTEELLMGQEDPSRFVFPVQGTQSSCPINFDCI